MDEIINIIFMKYGTHASEEIESIILRKEKEIETCGMMFWGYGGNLCHPLNQIQPFIALNKQKNEKTYLLMSKTNSQLNNQPTASMDYSIDKLQWFQIPSTIQVYGSRYAIVCSSIKKCDFKINLNDYIVPIGNAKGTPLSRYIRGRVDKACGTYSKNYDESVADDWKNITLCAELIYPYAVFVR